MANLDIVRLKINMYNRIVVMYRNDWLLKQQSNLEDEHLNKNEEEERQCYKKSQF